ncbi:coiled-coil domain-containing protein 125 isoform X1 [Alligator sinensis]|uniref:Coiled-coil domain-containing protein 125 isoform X1 n=1 Tax=Alligator sinensis TaxID=38654 RepID=A0A1U7SC72_ALLSI|nr:coiled-coil domain-containing protein 125 isoform X1 [Alligator sinensis]XP_006033064.1 coiled-coil domain-containing protein 125 isoform X1 [Alligator sinensis]XP_025070546.1 coiled-coil domain-containing protein 125 isoform X1 [Alligator sinensis]XP_025070547.1 coiled-coil domain-containing protein 125 isoform X1 [Alligator sinensis]XP_025070548.1 coiled-coil domain-containing protein 125 isoform X1 [Alligator sinensis]
MSEVLTLQEKQEDEEAEESEDDMTCGDLGNGLGRRPGGVYETGGLNVHTFRSRKGSDKIFSPFLSMKKMEENDVAVFHCSKCNGLYDVSSKKFGIIGAASFSRQNCSESNSEVPNEELKQHLRDALEEIEILKVELETSQRQLEGKGEALRILQNMAVFNKATSHTKAMLQKAEEKKRTLEKEINALQWEIEYDQDRFKNIEETWTEKYDRIYCENAALKETLKLRTDEVKILKSENTILSQQHLEFLAMLDVKQQKVVQENMSFNKTGFTDITGLELAVLGACTCNPSGEPCSCAKMSAVTRKQLLQLKQETEHLKKSKDEAYIMADAFRIAFEQQLMQRKDQALRFTQVNKLRKKETKFINWKRLKEDGHITSQGNKKSLGQKLAGMLISDADCRTIEELHNPHEALRVLVDLLNDKEEALAHQRKVSYMLARAKELKEETSKQSKENNLSGESITQKNCQYSTTESQESSHCANSCCQNPGSQNSTCSTYNTKVLKNSLRSLRKSYSWPPGTMHCKENDAHEIGRTTDVDSTS